ncbi:MAG: indole-3-glycerol phosphate synthase TrpC [Gemmatimonadaceae bacterium]
MGTLGDLVAGAARRAEVLGGELRAWRDRAEAAAPPPSLRAAMLREAVGVVAEIKRMSPSRGEINPSLDAAAQARLYVTGGAAAISVLTEPEQFGGSSADLAEVAAAVALPILKKDFHVAPVQLYEARALGASAALLIARALEPEQLRDMIAAAEGIGLESLVEVRDEIELGVALSTGANLIGVNNRNLETLVIDASTAARIIPMIPSSVVAIAESGISSRAEVERAAAFGADGVLVGSAISSASDPVRAVAQLAGAPVTRNMRPRDSR